MGRNAGGEQVALAQPAKGVAIGVNASVPVESSPRIRILPPAVAEQIAAGEVVERPASVVKELVENSIDAGATRIAVELCGGGMESIVVVDDGHGMPPEDAVLAFRRHATSKIASAADLLRVKTLGFRGEALAAIAAISEVVLITRPRAAAAGTRVVVQGGVVRDVREAGAAPGTRVEVHNLFFNTPARRKFLRGAGTEVGHVTELVVRFALAYPQIGFSLRHGSRSLLECSPAPAGIERLVQVFGPERAARLREVRARGAVGSVEGWIADPQLHFPTARNVYIYVNGRFVRDRLITHALLGGYATLLVQGRYPGAVLFVCVPPDEVDVNVHPAKAEVRFRRGGLVHELVARAVSDCLRNPSGVPGATTWAGPGGREELVLAAGVGTSTEVAPAPEALRLVAMPPAGVPREGSVSLPCAELQPSASLAAQKGFFSSLAIVGQIFDGYLVCQRSDAMVLIDQHAAHERVVFEQLRHAYAAGGVARQPLLVPAVVELRPREAAVLAEAAAELQRIGFEIEPFGNGSVLVRAVPALLADANPAGLLRDLAEELGEEGSSRRLADAAEAVLSTLACHSAVRVGQALNGGEIRALLGAMDEVDFASQCPHGRPAFLSFSRAEIERRFRRR